MDSKKNLVDKANNLARKCLSEGKTADAAALFIKVINIDPTNTYAIVRLCEIYSKEKKHDLVEKILQGAVRISPNNEHFHLNLGKFYGGIKDYKSAKASFEKAVALNPKLKEGQFNLGYLAARKHQYDVALAYYNTALKIAPDDPNTYNNIAIVLRAEGRLEEAMEYQSKAVQLSQGDFPLYSNFLFYKAQSLDVSPEEYLQEAKKFGKFAAECATPYRSWPALDGTKSIRVGFVSGDFYQHPVTFFIEQWLPLLSKNIDLVAYYNFDRYDIKTKALQNCFSEWNDVTQLSDESLAAKIYNDRINILIDLSGHTAHNRLPVFAWKPAPIQVSWVGFFASTGLDEMDYLMQTEALSPNEFSDHYVEDMWYLKSAGCMKEPEVDVSVADLPVTQNGYVTFGSFHSLGKVSDEVVSAWSAIIKKVPSSKLFMKCKEFESESVLLKTISRFENAGLERDRLIFEPPSEKKEYFSAYNNVDIGLDPFPYNSGTVAYHSLWMGVPYVSLIGDRLLSRIGYSSLNLAGLGQLAVESVDEYISTAVNLSNDIDKLIAIRKGLRSRIVKTSLFDGASMAEDLELTFTSMYEKYKSRMKT